MNDDAVHEQAYLVARGVRPLALVEQCVAEHQIMLQAATRLETLGDKDAIPFVLDRGDGIAECGYAAARWVLDLLRWTLSPDVPPSQRGRIIGLLLGYSPDAVQRFENANRRLQVLVASSLHSGRLWDNSVVVKDTKCAPIANNP